jgi:hypothetical protein
MGFFSSLADTFSTPNAAQQPNKASNDIIAASGDLQLDKLYQPDPNNWYTSKPYGFKLLTRSGTPFIMFLPINPSNLNISTNFATNVVPTLYGTVEEHSDIRYFDITIEGTTAMAPKFVEPANSTDPSYAYGALKQTGRAMFPIASSVALGGFFSNTIAQVSNILNAAGKAVSAITGSGNQPQETALYNNQTGYMAFHNLYRFLLKYKKDAAGVESNVPRTGHPLTFFNYKDGNEYDVVVKNFILRKSPENPMLYYYQITMRGYNIRSSGQTTISDDLQSRLADLGLNGVKSSSLLSTIKGISDDAKAVVGSVSNGINLFGR